MGAMEKAKDAMESCTPSRPWPFHGVHRVGDVSSATDYFHQPVFSRPRVLPAGPACGRLSRLLASELARGSAQGSAFGSSPRLLEVRGVRSAVSRHRANICWNGTPVISEA